MLMTQILRRIYQHLPASSRSAAATMRGVYLRSWRYGPDTERLVEAAREREHWSARQWKEWQEQRLAYVLHRAATKVPYYREQWAERRRKGDRASWQYPENWPILEKQALRENMTAFVAEDCDREKMFLDQTSGTTGTPLKLWQRRETVRAWYALFEARARRWHGVTWRDRWAILGGQPVISLGRSRPPFWVWNAAMNQLYISTFHLKPEFIPYTLDALRQYGITHVIGYTAALNVLAEHMERLGRRDLNMRVVVTNAEPVYDYQRSRIARAFQCPVRETYGMAEIVAAASECEHGTLHLWPEAGWLEILENGRPVPPGTAGDLICTSLFNIDMPLIRYAVGDRMRLPAEAAQCGCGRTLPAAAAVEGRRNDALLARDGRKIFWLNPTFYGLPVREAQIVQESRERVKVFYVPSPEFTADSARTVIERLCSEMGEIEVTLNPVDEIPREANGKFRAVVCKV